MFTRYLLYFWGSVEPQVLGPYENDADRVAAAKELYGEEHAFARLNIDENGKPSVESFNSGELSDEEE